MRNSDSQSRLFSCFSQWNDRAAVSFRVCAVHYCVPPGHVAPRLSLTAKVGTELFRIYGDVKFHDHWYSVNRIPRRIVSRVCTCSLLSSTSNHSSYNMTGRRPTVEKNVVRLLINVFSSSPGRYLDFYGDPGIPVAGPFGMSLDRSPRSYGNAETTRTIDPNAKQSCAVRIDRRFV